MRVLRPLLVTTRLPLMVWGILLGSALIGVLNPSRAADGPKTDEPQASYVGMKMCAVCHAKTAEPWLAGAHGKALSDTALPEGMFGCEACHGPGSRHVGSTGKQPMPETCQDKTTAEAACVKCHMRGEGSATPATWPNLKARNWQRTLHARNGTSCLSCHKIHGPNEQALSQPAGELCLSCHKTLVNPEPAGYTHAPVAKGQCLLCHTPHGGPARHDLIDKVGTTCLSCHPLNDALRAAHGKYAVDQADCTSCHNPHSFDRARKLLRKTEHAPLRKCELCHTPSDGAAKPGLVKPVKELCVSCHPTAKIMPEKNAAGEPMKAHPPVAQGLCTACHNPHASDHDKLMKDRVDNTCFQCHATTETETLRPVSHKPLTTGNCLLCHQAHASANRKLLSKPPLEECLPCHATQMKFSHPVGMRQGKPVIDPSTKQMLTCARCHAIHGATVPRLLPAEESDLCRSCHKH
ncbi:MAG: cytochrome c3 family protein [Armatimonadota bacterium]